MRHLKKFNESKNKTVMVLHGLGGNPAQDRIDYLEKLGYNVIYPHIDFEKEWNKDKCNSLVNNIVNMYNDVDLFIGMSLGGYLAFILANIYDKHCILINPSLNREKSKLKIKDFDYNYQITNPHTDVFHGELDKVVNIYDTIDYLHSINYKYELIEVKSMEHRVPISNFINILRRSDIK